MAEGNGAGTTEAPASVQASSIADIPLNTAGLHEQVARPLPTGFDWLARSFPTWSDPVADELDSRAYTIIRRTDVTAYPVRKLGMKIAGRRLKVTPETPAAEARAKALQTILDKTPRLDVALRELVWGFVDGVIFGWLTGRVEDGYVIPAISVRRKVKAGGLLEWDGQHVVKRMQFDVAVGGSSGNDSKAEVLPRDRVIVWRPGNDSSPEGDTDLAWQLFLIAEESQSQRKNRIRYGDRHGMPWEIAKRLVDGMRPTAVEGALTATAEKLKKVPHQGVAMPTTDLMQLLEPSGATWQFLSEYDRDLAKRAHQLILLNALTSDTTDAGPTGSSRVHADEQSMAEDAVARSLAEALTSDLLPFVEFHNSALLPPGGRCRIALEPADLEPEPKAAEVLTALEKGLAFDAKWLYGLFGATPPPGTPEVIKLDPIVANPFGGGFGNPFAPPGGAQAAPAAGGNPFAPAPPKLARLDSANAPYDAARATIERAVAKERATLAAIFEQFLGRLAQGGSLPDEVAPMLAASFARMHWLGYQQQAEELERLAPKEKQGALRAIHRRAAALRTEEQVLQEIATRYQAIAVRASLAATDALREKIVAKVSEFIEQGGALGDGDAFRDWVVAQQPNFTESYADLVLRNGVNHAYIAGRNQQYREVGPALGLHRKIFTAGDNAVRPEHRLYDGVVLPPGEQWDYLLPPFDHNCRCTMAVVLDEPSSEAELQSLPRPPFADNPR